ncbi:MAG: hypothetical protein ACE5H8_14510 [Alphaproteobacteria bacterium]
MSPSETEQLLCRARQAIVHARIFEAQGDLEATEMCCEAARDLLARAQATLGERLDHVPRPGILA